MSVSGWAVGKLGHLGRFYGGGTPSKDNPEFWSGPIPWVSPKDMKSARIVDAEDHISAKAVRESATRMVPPGSLLMVVRSGILQRTIPVGINGVPVALNQDMKAFVSYGHLDARYLLYWIVGEEPRLLSLWRKEGATVESLDLPLVEDTEVPVPPMSVQRAVATFLDRKAAAIDALIAKKERLISLLGERVESTRSRLISSSTGPFTKLGYCVDLLPGFAFSSDGFLHGEDGIRLLRGANVGVGNIRWNEVVRWPESDSEIFRRYALKVGDVIIGMDRPWIGEGARVAQVKSGDTPALLLQRVARLRSRPALRQDYLALLLASDDFRGYFEPILTGVSVPHISPEQIRSFKFRLPSLDQQDADLREFARVSSERDKASEILVLQLNRLREYRQALISAAVTGKLDIPAEDAA